MFQRIIEIIVYVITELRRNKALADIDVDGLRMKGYTPSEISTALSWIVDRVEFSSDFISFDAKAGRDSFRMLHDAEKELFTKEAWGDMVHYQSLGILNNDHLEAILEKASLTGAGKIDSEKLKTMIAVMIFNARPDHDTVRLMLLGNETIN